jgi:MFS family permease
MVAKIRKFPLFPLRGVLVPLTIPDFRRLLSSSFLWWETRFMEMVVVGWLVLELTDSAWQVAVIGFYRSIPFLAVGFLSGPLIDRFGRRKIILTSQIVYVLIYGFTAVLLWIDRLAFWHLAVGALLIGTAWSLDWPARRSLLPDMVGKARTVDALLLENFAQNVSRIFGPFIGGSLIAAFGVGGAYGALTSVSGLSLLILLGLSNQPIPRRTKAVQSSALTDIIEGLRYVRRTPPILGALLITVAMNFLVFPYVTLLPVFARDVLHQGPVGLGILGAASGMGAFLGLFVLNRIRRFASDGWIFAVGSCFQSIALIIFSFSTNYTLSLTLLFLSGIGQVSFGILQSSIILLSASDEMRSRAMGTLVLAIGAGPLGQLQVGGLAETLGAPLAVRLHTLAATILIMVITSVLPGFRQRAPEGDDTPTLAPADG